MRDLPVSLQAALDSGATTLARCWAVTRNDGLTMGFTDHDRVLTFEGISFEPESGFTPSAVESGTGLAPDTHAVQGALSSPKLTEQDIRKGLYDGAEVAFYLVDWSDTESRTLLSRGRIGEIRRLGAAFEAEVAGLSDTLNVTIGRAFLHSCACRLGEAKCGIDLGDPAFNGTATIVSVDGTQRFTVAGLGSFDNGWFAGGLLTWTGGENAGVQSHVKTHLPTASGQVIELWQSPALPVFAGDGFTVTAGCDKTAETCAARFGNLENFRGFPHIPGDDVVASYPSTGGAHDGGSLFRG